MQCVLLHSSILSVSITEGVVKILSGFGSSHC